MPCEAENPNVPVSLGLAYNPETHSCDWPDLLTHLGCDPAERLGGFQCPQLRGQTALLSEFTDPLSISLSISLIADLEGTSNELYSPFPRFAGQY